MVSLEYLRPAFRSSGDFLADRRFNYACSYAGAGEHKAAAELLEQVIECAPAWPAAWFALGQAHAATGSRAAAVSAFARAQALDPSDELGASLQLARVGDCPAPAAAPESYVRALFEQYAGSFDAHLERLLYRAPVLLADEVGRLGRKSFTHAIDLGCGTGLCGEAFRGRTELLTGVDLSPRMIEAARCKRLYDRLLVQSIGSFLASEAAQSADLLLAADVLVYVGDLDPILCAARRVLRENGIFAFTLQAAESGVRLGEDLRYAHAPAYVRELAVRYGFATATMLEATSRQDAGLDVPGLVVVLVA